MLRHEARRRGHVAPQCRILHDEVRDEGGREKGFDRCRAEKKHCSRHSSNAATVALVDCTPGFIVSPSNASAWSSLEKSPSLVVKALSVPATSFSPFVALPPSAPAPRPSPPATPPAHDRSREYDPGTVTKAGIKLTSRSCDTGCVCSELLSPSDDASQLGSACGITLPNSRPGRQALTKRATCAGGKCGTSSPFRAKREYSAAAAS
eukprot:scaffold154519_cov36-Tisochrysis_lutea.AAC.1